MKTHSSYVVGFAFSHTYESVLLVEKKKPTWQSGSLNGIGGSIEPSDRSPVHAMGREAFEEIGWSSLHWHEFAHMEGENADHTTWEVFCFITTMSVLSLRALHGHFTDVMERCHVLRVSELYNFQTIPNLKWLIPLAIEHSNLDPIFGSPCGRIKYTLPK